MAAPYPIFNGTTFQEFFAYPNQLLDNFWGPLLLTVIIIILTVMLYQSQRVNRIEEALAASMFTASILGILMAAGGIIQGQVALITVVITGVLAFILFITRK